jgi:hypothetical protein
MLKAIAIVSGAALATLAFGAAQAGEPCGGPRACQCPPAYGHYGHYGRAQPPPRVRAPAYGHAPPPVYRGYAPSADHGDYPPAAYYGPRERYHDRPREPYGYRQSYYEPPPPTPRAPLVGYRDRGYPPPSYRDFRYPPPSRDYDHPLPFIRGGFRPTAGLWLEIR